ncbi:hypothetical protein JXL19_06075 [bacterium]|nr:hypothetical protein [bacterium]
MDIADSIDVTVLLAMLVMIFFTILDIADSIDVTVPPECQGWCRFVRLDIADSIDVTVHLIPPKKLKIPLGYSRR